MSADPNVDHLGTMAAMKTAHDIAGFLDGTCEVEIALDAIECVPTTPHPRTAPHWLLRDLCSLRSRCLGYPLLSER